MHDMYVNPQHNPLSWTPQNEGPSVEYPETLSATRFKPDFSPLKHQILTKLLRFGPKIPSSCPELSVEYPANPFQPQIIYPEITSTQELCWGLRVLIIAEQQLQQLTCTKVSAVVAVVVTDIL